MRVPIFQFSCQLLLLSAFLVIAILVSMKWDVIVVLIHIFLMTNDVEHLICVLAICISSSEKCLFISFAHF